MRNSHTVRLAGLALAAVGLAGSASAAGPLSAAKPGGIISTIAGVPGGPGPATT